MTFEHISAPLERVIEKAAEAYEADTFLQFVPHSRLTEFLANGWEISDELHGTNHGAYSVLCVWKGKGEPK